MVRDPLSDDVIPSLREVERGHIQRVLDDVGWNKRRAARILGINRGTLYRKIGEYELVDRRPSRSLRVDPVRTGTTDADQDQRNTGPAQHKSDPVGEPRLPREIAEHENGRTGGEGAADDDGGGSGPGQAK
jgi:hypothetical protein